MSSNTTTKNTNNNSTNNSEFLEEIVASSSSTISNHQHHRFPAEANRYALYVTAGCPFAARPWAVQALYGLPISIIPLFPAAHDDGWFFTAQSAGEHDMVASYPQAHSLHKDPLHDNVHHLKQLYWQVNPNFDGAVSVPLLWDTQLDTAVNNSSLGLSEMLATQMKQFATRNQEIDLFPGGKGSPEWEEHQALVQELHATVTTVMYQINATNKDGNRRDALVKEFYDTLTRLQNRLTSNNTHQPFLMGQHLRFADLVLYITLVRFDISYQWRFGLGKYSIRENYPGLWAFTQRIVRIPGISEALWPRDIMAMYFMGTKWNQKGQGRSVPMVPVAWNDSIALPMSLTSSSLPSSNDHKGKNSGQQYHQNGSNDSSKYLQGSSTGSNNQNGFSNEKHDVHKSTTSIVTLIPSNVTVSSFAWALFWMGCGGSLAMVIQFLAVQLTPK